MKKSLIIGAATGYNYSQLKPWVESIGRTNFTGDKVLIIGDIMPGVMSELEKQGFKLIPMVQVNAPVHVARFLTLYHYLKEVWQDYEYIITTDVKDVYFQYDPTEWLRTNLGSKKLVAGSESIRYKDESWGNENLLQTYGPYIYDDFKNNIIYNVGTIGGVAEYVKDLVFNIFTNAINRPIPIVDQAVYNVLIQTQPYLDITYFADQVDGWACQAGTTVDPSKIDGFRPFLTEEEPIWDGSKVLTSLGDVFCIVHQYDRVPAWKKFIQEEYGQIDQSQYFTYKTL